MTERDKYGNTPLHILVKETTPQTIECIDLLLEKGADINALNNGMCTPFFVCAQATDRQFRNRNALLLKHLLTRGAYADTQDFRQNNPLYYAVQDDDLERVSLLLKAGVDPNCRNEQNVSPYKLALQKNRRGDYQFDRKVTNHDHCNPGRFRCRLYESLYCGATGRGGNAL